MKALTYFISLIILSSCCFDTDLIDTIRFTETELAVNPYTGNEELKFVDSSGIIITYNNGERNIKFEEVSECKEGCCDYYNVETFENTRFKSVYKKESDFNIIISSDFDEYYGKKINPNIHFVWQYRKTKPLPTFISTSFGGLPLDSIKEKGIEYGMYKDSILLKSRMYYDIFTLPGYCYIDSDSLHGDTLYYSIKEGIVGLMLSDGNLLLKQ
jgi:hypothetical protein